MARMNRYFNDLDTLHRFTLSLDCQMDPIRCHHCSKTNQFVSHGFVYKKQHHGKTRTVGKRIFCSNRSGHSGCGRTLRLYLVTEISKLHYTAVHITAFVLALLCGRTIQQAYLAATQSSDPRNAYRWLNKLQRKLIGYRALLKTQCVRPICQFAVRTRERHILLATLQALFSAIGTCAQVQQQTQASFV